LLTFPREKWRDASQCSEFGNAGVYILVGDNQSDELDPTDPHSPDNLQIVYVGEGDDIRERIESHDVNKGFWSWGIAFVATNRQLNKAHVQWLEYSLVKRAKEVNQCKLENKSTPGEPALSEIDKAYALSFLREIYQMLPLANLRVFEKPKPIVAPRAKTESSNPSAPVMSPPERDTIIVPARIEGFKETFLGENCWYAIRISGEMLPKIRWIAGYQIAPISAITHVAPVGHIERYGEGKKYKVVFSEPAREIRHIPFGDAPKAYMMGSHYTTYAQLMKARKLTDLIGKV
jgi:hypothetical protein